MTVSAAGAVAAGTMWSLIALFRSPASQRLVLSLQLFADDLSRWQDCRRADGPFADQHVTADYAPGSDGSR